MVDKEIIIDGVDVSQCYGYIHNAKEYDCGETYSKFHYRYCEENPNCYFKQLKHIEQELNDLRERYEKCKKSNSNYATATIKRNFKLQRIKEKWRELIKMTPLDIVVNPKKILELDNIIEER